MKQVFDIVRNNAKDSDAMRSRSLSLRTIKAREIVGTYSIYYLPRHFCMGKTRRMTTKMNTKNAPCHRDKVRQNLMCVLCRKLRISKDKKI